MDLNLIDVYLNLVFFQEGIKGNVIKLINQIIKNGGGQTVKIFNRLFKLVEIAHE